MEKRGAKKGLLNKANELGLAVSNINAQFAFFRQEMTAAVGGSYYYSNLWEKCVLDKTSVQDKCDAFRIYIEGTNGGISARRDNAQAIYDALK